MADAHETVTRYQLRGAVEVARLLDEHRISSATVDHAYMTAITGGRFPLDQLLAGEILLQRANLVLRAENDLLPSRTLGVLAALDDEQAILALAAALGVDEPLIRQIASSRQDDLVISFEEDSEDIRVRLGEAGEREVCAFCRDELVSLGELTLAESVQRVSLVSDALGYDVVAPTIHKQQRLLEVKTQAGVASGVARFFITRNEYERGCSQRMWALVFCDTPDGLLGDVVIRGWCRAGTLKNYLPEDRNGRWTEALVQLPLGAFLPDVPSAV